MTATVPDTTTGIAAAVATASRPPAKPKKDFLHRPLGEWTVRIVTFVLIFGGWEIGAANVNRALIAPPSEIFASFIRQVFVEGTIWGPFFTSIWVLFAGLAISLVIGLPIGLAMGRWKRVAWSLDPFVYFLYALPHVALVPLMIILLGFDWPFRLAYVFIAAVWPIILNTMAGVRAVDKDLLDAATAFGSRESQTVRKVILPAASPFMVAGFRQAFSSAWVGVVVSEILSTLVGLGGQIERFSLQFLTADMFVPIFMIMFVAVAIQSFTAWAQKRLTPWQPRI